MSAEPLSAVGEDFHLRAIPLEKSVLVTVLETPSLLRQLDGLAPSDFLSPNAKAFFDWINTEFQAERGVTPEIAMSKFAGSDLEPYVMGILTEIPRHDAVVQNVHAMKELAVRASSLQALLRSAKDIRDSSIPVEATIHTISAKLSRAGTALRSKKKRFFSYSQIGEQWAQAFKKKIEDGEIPGIQSGFAALDDIIVSMQPTDLVIIAGRPAMGKTTFAMNIAEHAAKFQGKVGLVFSMEMPADQLFQRTVSGYGEIDAHNLRTGKLKHGEVEKLGASLSQVQGLKLFVCDEPALSPMQMTSIIYDFIEEHGQLDFILVDYLQLMALDEKWGGNMAAAVGANSMALKTIAKTFNIAVIALSQLSRALEARPNKRPMNSDLRESGAIEQDANLIMFVYRDEVYHPETEDKGIAEIIVGKQRAGALGTAKLGWMGRFTKFVNLVAGSISGLFTLPDVVADDARQRSIALANSLSGDGPGVEINAASHVEGITFVDAPERPF
ncbi:replicative DNA helicase [Pseudomonas nitritireducens]|uniref:Replicative DNA helicase n=1 Tax=Pseudomonas nitroreducens TaxID=46680 RepID=A0A7W7KEI3_PSENT|nr:replicative DNA helicase [Pseudomonas nitritireducens]MBB4861359.1 replicative DNA helicase [Pseudomonas nitritireducens]